MLELIDKEVSLEFIGEQLFGSSWPTRAYVRGVALPMIELQSYWGSDKKWVNLSLVKWIRADERQDPDA